MRYEVVYAFAFDEDDDEAARRHVRAILHRLGDVARSEATEIEPRAFVDERGRDVPLSTPAPERPAIVDPETTRATRAALRLRLTAPHLRIVSSQE